MLVETTHLKITAEGGIATLWLHFPGEPANGLDLSRLRELDTALAAVAATRSIRILVIRSAHSGGFCAGVRPEVLAGLRNPPDRAAFSWYGQQVFDRLASLEAISLAFLEGSCLGAGLELALACDFRLCLASPFTHLGFPDRLTCFGGAPRLHGLIGRAASRLIADGKTLSGREAQSMKVVDLAFCERRSRIELRSFLDHLERYPMLPRRQRPVAGFASERRVFASSRLQPLAHSRSLEFVNNSNPIPTFPRAICLLGDDSRAASIAAAAVLKGSRVLTNSGRSAVIQEIEVYLKRGFITPLESERARQQVVASSDPDDYFGVAMALGSHENHQKQMQLPPRTIIGLIDSHSSGATAECSSWPTQSHNQNSSPARIVHLRFSSGKEVELFASTPHGWDAVPILASWLKALGCLPTIHTRQPTWRRELAPSWRKPNGSQGREGASVYYSAHST